MKQGAFWFRGVFLLWFLVLLSGAPGEWFGRTGIDQAEASHWAGPLSSRDYLGTGTDTCPADLDAYWKLDEIAGPNYADFFGGHTATCTASACAAMAPGLVNSAQAFGSATVVNVAAAAAFDWGVNDSFSIEYWVQTDAVSTCETNQVVLGRHTGATTAHWWSGCLVGGLPAFYARDQGGTLANVVGTTDITDGEWHHVVAVRDAAADQLRIFVDGAQEGVVPASYSQGFASATIGLNVGWLPSGGGWPPPGRPRR